MGDVEVSQTLNNANEKEIDLIINKLEKNYIQKVIGYRNFYLKKGIYSIDYEVACYREIELLEMAIFNYLILEFKNKQNTLESISRLTGIDEVFFKKTLEELINLKLIVEEDDSLNITEEGKNILKEKRIPIPKRKEKIEFIYDKSIDKCRTYKQNNFSHNFIEENDEILDLSFLNQLYNYEIITPKITKDIIQDISQDNSLEKMVKKRIEEIRNISEAEYLFENWSRYLLVYVYDYLDVKIYLRIWDWTEEKFVDEILEVFKNNANYDIDEKLRIYALDRASRLPAIDKIEKKYSDKLNEVVIKTSKREVNENEHNNFLIKQIRNEKIKPEFNKMLKETKKIIIISTPWISEKVINKQMIDQFEGILKRGGKIVISWGYADSIDQESKFC